MMRPGQRHAGFTLLEIIIAVGIFAVISALAYGGLNTILRGTQQTEAAADALQRLQLGMSIIQQDLAQITNRPVRNEYGEREGAVVSPGTFGRLIGFTRRGWKNPAERPRSTLQRVAYRLEENRLIREYWPQLDTAPGSETIETTLLCHLGKPHNSSSLSWRRAPVSGPYLLFHPLYQSQN